MRRLFFVIVLALLALPLVSFAQDDQPKLAWELKADTFVDVTDMGIRFYYPTGWLVDTSKGVTIAETQEDIDLSNDGDASTQPTGMVITVGGLPKAAFADLGDDATLDAIADFVVEKSNVTEESRVEAPVMARRSISIVGTSNGRDGVASLWQQGDFVGVASLGLPDSVSIDDVASTWGATLASIAPLGAQDLGEGTITDNYSKIVISYPKDWSADPNQPGTIYELADDVGAKFGDVKGSVLNLTDGAFADLGLKDDATLDDLVALATKSSTLGEDATSEEFVFLGQPAVTVTGTPTADSPGAGHGFIFTATIIDGRGVVLLLVTPTPEAATALMPTWIQILRNVKPLEASS